MSSTTIIENERITFRDIFIFEGIKPQKVEFGTNSQFNNNNIFKINDIYATTFKYKDLIYTVIINGDIVGFHLSYLKEIQSNVDFSYVDFILNSEQLYPVSNNNALSIFSYVFYIIEHIISKYNLKVIKFDGENHKLKDLYAKLVKNKLFQKEFNKLGFIYTFDNNQHTFIKE